MWNELQRDIALTAKRLAELRFKGVEMNDYQKLEQAKRFISEVQANLEEPSEELPPEDEWRWKDCNLWKPKGENNGRLVVLIRGDWKQPDFAEVMKRNGTWERMDYTGVSNFCGPEALERYTFRGNSPGGPAYAGKNRGGGVRLWYGNEFAFLPLPGPPKNRYE